MQLTENVMFIRAGDGFTSDGWRNEGYRAEKPFREKGLFLRLVREAWFRLHLPFREIFYNKKVLNFAGEHLIVYDPQITREYLQWLQQQKSWKIHYFYGNMVGKARHLHPEEIPTGIDVWTYERNDSEKYHLRLTERQMYWKAFCQPKEESEYDVLFVGKDKGRGDFLFDLEKALKDAGLNPYFCVVGDIRFQKKKDKRYGSELPYHEICKLIAKSRAILNVALPGQTALTIRDFEAICNDVKLITTNPHIKDMDFYDPARILVIDDIDTKQIEEFLGIAYKTYPKEFVNVLSSSAWVEEIIQ